MIKYTQKYVKMAGLESIYLNTVYVLSGREQLGENPMCVNIYAVNFWRLSHQC